MSEDPHFFGYGSLVNTATHSYAARPARLTGWRRLWCQTDARPFAYLSVRPCPATQLQGTIAPVQHGDWEALDAREAAYERHAVTHQIDQPTQHTAVYAVPGANLSAQATRHPILMSYLDVVLQGYLQMYGEAGAQGFLDTTDGWETPIADDRTEPIYPRAQSLTASQSDWVDAALVRLSAVVQEL